MPNRSQPRILQVASLAAAVAWLASTPRRPRHALLWSALCFAADLIAVPTILRAKPAITASELETLDPKRLSRTDRIALELPAERRANFQKMSDRVLQLSVALPLLWSLQRRTRGQAESLLQDYVWGHALTYTLYTFGPFGPAFVDKFRPIVYRHEVPTPERSNGNNRNSQYSGHTGNAAFAGVFVAKCLAGHYSLPKRVLLFMAAAPGLFVGSLRIRAQKHFPSDVLLAGVIGAAVAISLRSPRQ